MSAMHNVISQYIFDMFKGFKVFFFTVGGFYIAYLLLLILRAYSELRSMPYFGEYLRMTFSSIRKWKKEPSIFSWERSDNTPIETRFVLQIFAFDS